MDNDVDGRWFSTSSNNLTIQFGWLISLHNTVVDGYLLGTDRYGPLLFRFEKIVSSALPARDNDSLISLI